MSNSTGHLCLKYLNQSHLHSSLIGSFDVKMYSTKIHFKKREQEIMLPAKKLNKLALIYGILLGDGCLSKIKNKYYFISIVGNIKEDFKFFNEVVVPNLSCFRKAKIPIRKRYKQRKIEILFTDKRLFSLISSIGFPIGKKGINLNIPPFFNSICYKAIIKGYFATDGCLVITNNNGVIYPRIEFSSISKMLLFQVSEYLQSRGMKGKVYSHVYPNKKYFTLFRLQFNGKTNLKIFRKNIGFVNPKHQEKFDLYVRSAEGEV